MPNITVQKRGVGGDLALYQALSTLEDTDVLVGIPQERASRPKGKINNAELMFIQTNGSPIRNIPPRPVIEPAIQADGNRQTITDELEDAADALIDQEPVKAKRFLQRAGMAAANASKRWFVDPRNNWAPNAPSTIRAKGSNRPLIDTGELRKAITYILRMGK